eukprot:scaffold16909_cov64-Phaeocystis_antarctica.AAC.2
MRRGRPARGKARTRVNSRPRLAWGPACSSGVRGLCVAYDRVDDVDAVAQVVAAEPEEPPVVPRYAVRTARPRPVRVRRTYSAWSPGARGPTPQERTARRRLVRVSRAYSTEAPGRACKLREAQADLDHEDGEEDEVAVPHRLVPGRRLAVPRRRVPAQYQGQGRARGRGRVGVGLGAQAWRECAMMAGWASGARESAPGGQGSASCDMARSCGTARGCGTARTALQRAAVYARSVKMMSA